MEVGRVMGGVLWQIQWSGQSINNAKLIRDNTIMGWNYSCPNGPPRHGTALARRGTAHRDTARQGTATLPVLCRADIPA